jgi:hypothetical protein
MIQEPLNLHLICDKMEPRVEPQPSRVIVSDTIEKTKDKNVIICFLFTLN